MTTISFINLFLISLVSNDFLSILFSIIVQETRDFRTELYLSVFLKVFLIIILLATIYSEMKKKISQQFLCPMKEFKELWLIKLFTSWKSWKKRKCFNLIFKSPVWNLSNIFWPRDNWLFDLVAFSKSDVFISFNLAITSLEL